MPDKGKWLRHGLHASGGKETEDREREIGNEREREKANDQRFEKENLAPGLVTSDAE